MNIFNKVTLKTLRKNKTRTFVTIIGVMLSAAMICAVTTFVSSMQNYILQFAIYNFGDWHAAVYNAELSDYTAIASSNKTLGAVYSQRLGYSEINSKNQSKPYIYVLGGSKNGFFDMLPVHMISGRLPENTAEIILPEHLATSGEVFYSIGDTLTLELGDIIMLGKEDDDTADANTAIAVHDERTYTVVGIYERPSFEGYNAPSFTALTVADNEPTSDARFNVYFKVKNASNIYDFCNDAGLDAIYNTDVLTYLGVSEYDSFKRILNNLAIIVIGLIMLGSVSLIYNAFAISVSERTKQFGLLSSLGATKRQLKRSVFFEALAVSSVGIPLGILVGIGGIGITLLAIGNKFKSLFAKSFDMPMKICVSAEAVAIAAGIALVTVLISAWIPSKRATRVSAIDAIRQNTDIKASTKPVKTSRLTYKLFGLSGVLAKKYYKRNKKKYRTTVLSLFMSIVLFISAASFTNYLTESVNNVLSTDKFDLYYICSEQELNSKTPDEMLSLLSSGKYITQAAYTNSSYINGTIAEEYLTDDILHNSLSFAISDNNNATPSGPSKEISGYLYFVNDAEFKALLKQYKFSEADYFNSSKPLGIALDNNVYFDAAKGKYVTCDTLKGDRAEIEISLIKSFEGYTYNGTTETENGDFLYVYKNDLDETDIMELTRAEAFVSFTLRSEKTITEAPFYIPQTTPTHIKMLYPISMLEYVIPNNSYTVKHNFDYYNFYMLSNDHAASYNDLKTILSENSFRTDLLGDYASTVDTVKNLILIMRVFSYGFIILISLIAAANVFNTISTNISLRRKEFAMLKSIGMTKKSLNKMMNYECILYGSKALLLGLPVSALITYLIYITVAEGYDAVYHLPTTAVCIAVFSVFAVVFTTMLYSMSKIKKENPIDALKNENL